jgi:glycosyltransferase involved in cell wall biosynthesis
MPSADRPAISCLTVTREGRLAELTDAVTCFGAQTQPGRELVIVHDGGPDFDRDVRGLAAGSPGAPVEVVRFDPGLSLGALRNLSLAEARGDVVCQWDDDDLYHPERLEIQHRRLVEKNADASFLTDQLHLFLPRGELFWDDWTKERFPMCLIQGTMMARRSRVGAYPEVPRGEDTTVMLDLVRAGARVVAIQERAWLYVYVFNGGNAWPESHHRDISDWKAVTGPRLVEEAPVLAARLSEYPIEPRPVLMPHDDGSIEMRIGGDTNLR